MNTSLTALQVQLVLSNLRDAVGDDPDDRLVLDTLEGETNLFTVTSRLLAAIEDDEGQVSALKGQVAVRQERTDRAKARVEARREAIQALMECAGLDKLSLPEATITLRKVAPKPIVTDADALPDAYTVTTRRPDMAAIKTATEPVPGVALDNGGLSLTVRRK